MQAVLAQAQGTAGEATAVQQRADDLKAGKDRRSAAAALSYPAENQISTTPGGPGGCRGEHFSPAGN